MGKVEDLKKELKVLQVKREDEQTIKKLKKQIKAEKFAQTKGGKIFNKIADIGDAGFRAGKKFLSPRPMQKGKKKFDANKIIKNLPQ